MASTPSSLESPPNIATAAEPSKLQEPNSSREKSSRLPTQKKSQSSVIDYSKWDALEAEDELATSSDGSPLNNNNKNAKLAAMPPVLKTKSWQEEQIEKVTLVAEKYRRAGNDHFKAHKYQEAIEAYTMSLNAFMNPESVTSSSKARDANEHKDNINPFAFLEKYRQPLPPIPINPAIYTNRALCYIHLALYTEAESDCTSALAIDPANVKAYYRRVMAREKLQEYEECLADLNALKGIVEGYEQLKATTIKHSKKHASSPNPGVTLKEIAVLRAAVERDIKANSEVQHIAKQFEADGTLAVLDAVMKSFETALSNVCDSGKNSNTLKENNQNSIESAAASEFIVRLLSHPESINESRDAIRVAGHLAKLCSDELTPVTAPYIIPILLAACQGHIENIRLVGKQIGHLLKSLLNGPAPSPQTLMSATHLFSILVTDESVLDLLVKMDINLGRKFGLIALNILTINSEAAADSIEF